MAVSVVLVECRRLDHFLVVGIGAIEPEFWRSAWRNRSRWDAIAVIDLIFLMEDISQRHGGRRSWGVGHRDNARFRSEKICKGVAGVTVRCSVEVE